MARAHVTAGDVLVSQGDKSRHLHLLVSGEVTLTKRVNGRDAVVCVSCAGDVIGERELLTGQTSMTTVRHRPSARVCFFFGTPR